MSIARLTNLQVVQSYAGSTSIIDGLDASRLYRLDNGRLVATWDTNIGGATDVLNFTTLDAVGLTHSAISTATSVPANKYIEQPRIASNEAGGFLAVWNTDVAGTTSPTSGDAAARFYTSAGAPAAAEASASTAPAGGEFTPSVTRLGNGNFLVTWSDTLATSGLSLNTEIMGRIYSPAGAALGGEFLVNATTAGIQFGTDLLTLGDGRTVAMWATGTASLNGIATTGLQGRFISASGTPLGTEFSIDTIAAGRTYENKTIDLLALGNGGFVAVWEEDSGAVEELHFQRFGPAGGKLGAETIIESVAGDRHILNFFATELSNGGFAVGWRLNGGVDPVVGYARQFSMTGVEIGTKTSLTTVAGTAGVIGIHDMELMADGHVMLFGQGLTTNIGTQILDFGDERLLGSNVADTLYGKNGVHDYILGYSGNDLLKGLTGNDTLDGGTGNDTLIGGGGSDSFVFATIPSATANRDTIADFNVAADTIKLENGVFAAFAAQAANTVIAPGAFWSNATGAAHDADDRIIYNSSTGVLSYDSNGSAAGGTIWEFAKITPGLALTNADFVVV